MVVWHSGSSNKVSMVHLSLEHRVPVTLMLTEGGEIYR